MQVDMKEIARIRLLTGVRLTETFSRQKRAAERSALATDFRTAVQRDSCFLYILRATHP
jgi:hypothetical protein